MKEKAWIGILAASLFVFVSGFCLAQQQNPPAKKAPAKPPPKAAPQAQPQRQPQARPATPQQRPQQPQARPTTPQQRPGGQQVRPGVPGQPGRPGAGQAGSITRQGTPRTVHQPGQTHPANRTELDRRLRAPVTRDAQQRAAVHYREERARFVRNAPPMRFVPGHRAVLTRMRIVPGTYHYRRTVFYETYGYVPFPYVYTMYPRYGLWDAVFLGFMVERAAEEREYALMYYNHRNEEEMIQWRQEMDRIAMDNAELRAKLDAMDQQVAQLQGTPVDSAYIPEGAQDIALSPEVIDQLAKASGGG